MDFGAPRYGRVPARVLLLGRDDGWHCEIIDDKDGRDRLPLAGSGVTWNGPHGREPAWWRGRLAADAAALRERVEQAVTDRAFTDLGVEADVAWFAVDDPVSWEGLVTLREPDPARYPGNVPPYVVTLEPERGAVLPEADVLFTAGPDEAWCALDAVAARLGSPAPAGAFICGYSGYRSVRIGRGHLGVGCMRDPDGTERVRTIFGNRPAGWGGNPELRFRLDGIDLLHEPAADVVTLFRDLGHDVAERHAQVLLPGLGLSLSRSGDDTRHFAGLTLEHPDPSAAPWRFF
ncbi:hypothetical protein [Actinomadura rayongensis]|uniref:Uncharacterized protein n=1 Tax=Actinomadura rayongensis TaxID=1429076 RepID=A0A6I4W2K1_9ACTN|nr:hypothetical protein [Actinomadura rayongensis]